MRYEILKPIGPPAIGLPLGIWPVQEVSLAELEEEFGVADKSQLRPLSDFLSECPEILSDTKPDKHREVCNFIGLCAYAHWRSRASLPSCQISWRQMDKDMACNQKSIKLPHEDNPTCAPAL
jgi:hypothetical protein